MTKTQFLQVAQRVAKAKGYKLVDNGDSITVYKPDGTYLDTYYKFQWEASK